MGVEGRAALLATVTEKEWQAQVVRWAERAGWYVYHTYDSRRSPGGFPDLVLVRPDRGILFVELKSVRGKLTDQQQMWNEALETASRFGCLVDVWRPDDEALVKRMLGV